MKKYSWDLPLKSFFFQAQNSKDCHTSLGISSTEVVLSGHVQRFLIQTLKSIFYYILELSFGNSAFEMLSIFPYVSRDDVFSCDILWEGKHTLMSWLESEFWGLIELWELATQWRRYHLSKLPRAELITFQLLGWTPILGVSTNSRPTKLWLTSTITEEIAQPLTLKICFRCHEWL